MHWDIILSKKSSSIWCSLSPRYSDLTPPPIPVPPGSCHPAESEPEVLFHIHSGDTDVWRNSDQAQLSEKAIQPQNLIQRELPISEQRLESRISTACLSPSTQQIFHSSITMPSQSLRAYSLLTAGSGRLELLCSHRPCS